jgi:hypothetical protein
MTDDEACIAMDRSGLVVRTQKGAEITVFQMQGAPGPGSHRALRMQKLVSACGLKLSLSAGRYVGEHASLSTQHLKPLQKSGHPVRLDRRSLSSS